MSEKLKLTMKPTERRLRLTQKVPVDQRVAATLDDIASALEIIAVQLERIGSKG